MSLTFNFNEGREREKRKGNLLVLTSAQRLHLNLLLSQSAVASLTSTGLLIYQRPDHSGCRLVRILLLQAPALSLPLKAALTKSLPF